MTQEMLILFIIIDRHPDGLCKLNRQLFFFPVTVDSHSSVAIFTLSMLRKRTRHSSLPEHVDEKSAAILTQDGPEKRLRAKTAT